MLGNAIKYTNPGGDIVIHVCRVSEQVRFEVEDSGLGISSGDLSRIFTPFTQVQNNNKKSEGNGLGLSIAKRIVEALSGSIGVESTLGRGSSFWIELPLEALPKATLCPTLNELPIKSVDQIHKLATFFGCRETPPPIPHTLVIGVHASGKSLEAISYYLGHWRITILVLESGAHIDAFLSSGNAHFFVDENLDFLQSLLGKLTEERGANLLATSTPPSVMMVSSLSSLSSVRKLILSYEGPARVGIATRPLDPLQLAKSVLYILGYDVRFRVGRSDQPDSASAPRSDSPTLLSEEEDSPKSPAEASVERLVRQQPKQEEPLQDSSLSLPSTGELEVLVIEDNSVNQMIMRKQLEKLKVSFVITPSAEEGIKIWSSYENPVPVILMDVEVEGPINGLQATSVIRSQEKQRARERELAGLRPVPASYIAVMTGRAMEADKLEALASGCDEFLTKPVSLNTIRDLVRTHIAGKQ